MKCTFCESESVYEYELNNGQLVQACEEHRRTGFYAAVKLTGGIDRCDYCKHEQEHSYTCKDNTVIKTCDAHKLKGYYKSLKHDGKKVTYMLRIKSSFPFIGYVPFIETK